MLNIPTKYIKTETGWGLLAVTVALSGAAIIPRWNPLIEYCVPHTECRIVKAVDPELFLWHQKSAALSAEKLRQKAKVKARAKHSKKKNVRIDETLENIDNTLNDASADFGEFTVGIQHTFAPLSSKEFLRLTAEARRKGWQLQAVQALPGYADWRKVAGALSLISVVGTAWVIGQLEILQQKRDRREELDEEFDLQQHRKALEGEATVIHAEIDWVSATEQKALEAQYLGDYYDDFMDDVTRGLDEDINRQEGALNQISGTQTLDTINNPADKVDHKTEPKFAIGASPGALKLDKSEDTAWKILYSVTSSRLSTLLVGTTGAGKSVFQCAWIIELARKSPDLQLYAVVQKQDYPVVIPDNRVVFFDQDNPTAALDKITKVWSIYDERRRNLRKYKDEGKLTPVRLILGDWLSVAGALKDMSVDLEVKASKYLTKIRDIAVNGRATNVCFIADLQSFNIEALGIKADVNIRKNFNIFGLGNYSMDSDGTVNDSYGVLDNIFINQFLIPDEETRKELRGEYQRLKSTSRSNNRPIMFCSLDPMSVVLMPDLRHYEHYKLAEPADTPNKINNSFSVSTPFPLQTAPESAHKQEVENVLSAICKTFEGETIGYGSLQENCKPVREYLNKLCSQSSVLNTQLQQIQSDTSLTDSDRKKLSQEQTKRFKQKTAYTLFKLLVEAGKAIVIEQSVEDGQSAITKVKVVDGSDKNT